MPLRAASVAPERQTKRELGQDLGGGGVAMGETEDRGPPLPAGTTCLSSLQSKTAMTASNSKIEQI